MNYQYTAKSATGATLQGVVAADSMEEARRKLRDRQLYVVSLDAAAGAVARLRGGPFWGRRKRISTKELLTLTSQLAIMVRAGVDFATALGNVAGQCRNPAMKAVLDQVHEDVLAGKSVSAALGAHQQVFGQTYVASVAAAEKAGRLPEVLNRLAHLLRSQLRMRSTLRTLLAYPVLLSAISVFAVVGLMLFVLPQFATVFADLEVPLPAVTQMLLAISAELRRHAWLWGGGAMVLVAGGIGYFRSTAGRRLLDSFLLNFVLLREVTRSLLVGRVFQLLGTMVESGVPLLEGLRLTRSAVSNSLFGQLLEKLEEEVLNGRGIGPTFLEASFIPPAAAQMMATAERTGTVATVAQLMGQFFEEEGERKLKELATILEPLIIVVMGAVIATIVMAVMLPVFDFATVAK